MSEPIGTLAVDDVRDLLGRWPRVNRHIADRAIAVLDLLEPSALIPIHAADVEALITIYSRRTRRASSALGGRELLAELERYTNAEVAMGSVSNGGHVLVLWLDLDLSTLVGCVVGIDHRRI